MASNRDSDQHKEVGAEEEKIGGVPVTRYWLIPGDRRPKLYTPHPVLSADEVRKRTQAVWDQFYGLARIWQRSAFIRSVKGRLAFLFISKLYRQMYAKTGIATDSGRRANANRWARWARKTLPAAFRRETDAGLNRTGFRTITVGDHFPVETPLGGDAVCTLACLRSEINYPHPTTAASE